MLPDKYPWKIISIHVLVCLSAAKLHQNILFSKQKIEKALHWIEE